MFALLLKWQIALWVFGASVLVFVLVGNGPVVRWLTAKLQDPAFFKTPNTFRGRTAIVLLGDGSIAAPNANGIVPQWLAYSRIECAARLFLAAVKAGASSTIIVTGDDSSKHQPDISVYAERLQSLGVQSANVTVERDGRNTYRQAELTSEILKRDPHESVFLVTSGLHMKRAMRYFRHFGVQPIPVASDYVSGQITLLPSARNFAIADIAIHQFIGLARLHVYNAVGLNKRSVRRRHSAAGTSN